MSYRNDHDAALSRIDALEAELGKNSDARERFTTLEQQLATAKAERDRAREALDKQDGGRGSRMIPLTLGAIALVIVGGFAVAVRAAAREPAPTLAPTPVVVAMDTREERTAELMACVATLDTAVARHAAVTDPCRTAIGRQATDLTLGDDIHQILTDWYAAESSLASGRASAGALRDALVARIHAYVIPSYTR